MSLNILYYTNNLLYIYKNYSCRRKLSVCPIIEGEEQLRLLNYQHNFISAIEHLSGLRRLIFLDLYDNQIEQIEMLIDVMQDGQNRMGL